MTVDEYLNKFKAVRRKYARMYDDVIRVETVALDVRSPSNMGDGIPGGRRFENTHETKLLKYADFVKEYRAVQKEYEETIETIRTAIDNMPYWAGCLIHHVFLYNVVFDEPDDLKGADEIVGSTDRRVILAKLTEAKSLLSDALRAQGVPIE